MIPLDNFVNKRVTLFSQEDAASQASSQIFLATKTGDPRLNKTFIPECFVQHEVSAVHWDSLARRSMRLFEPISGPVLAATRQSRRFVAPNRQATAANQEGKIKLGPG
jgi:hypothetical protein